MTKYKDCSFPNESSQPPIGDPPAGFCWKFIVNVWALVPQVQVTGTDMSKVEMPLGGMVDTKSHREEGASLECLSDSEGYITEFERNLKTLLPDLQVGTEAAEVDIPIGTRRSERPKKPSSRFTENAGFVAKPPKSSKKKNLKGDHLEGTKSLPLLINDWSDAQILNYCNACGIKFSDDVHVCINDIRMLERSRMANRSAETSVEVHENH